MNSDTLKVTVHVGRDLLQSAALFKHEHSVVWEYVSNGLEYKEDGVNPVVTVVVDSKNYKITIRDNGREIILRTCIDIFRCTAKTLIGKRQTGARSLWYWQVCRIWYRKLAPCHHHSQWIAF